MLKISIRCKNYKMTDVRYLFAPCPVGTCMGKPAHNWQHALCGGRTKIRFSDINILCDRCTRSGFIMDWLWDCGNHGYQAASKQGAIYSLTMILMQNADDKIVKNAIQKLSGLL
jgi:hypothetical protein